MNDTTTPTTELPRLVCTRHMNGWFQWVVYVTAQGMLTSIVIDERFTKKSKRVTCDWVKGEKFETKEQALAAALVKLGVAA